MPKCSFCEYEIPLPTSGNILETECPRCGRPIELNPNDSMITSATSDIITLVSTSNGKNIELCINQSLIIGRENYGSEILQDRKFSRKHCLIETNSQTLCICDLGSMNGTFVNGVRISAKTTLKEDDIIMLADEAFILKLNSSANPETEPETSSNLQVCVNCGYKDYSGLSRCPECGFGFL